jgi:penicillin-binding protein 1A
MVRQAMFDRFGSEAETSGYQVTTTVASKDQLAAEKAVLTGLVEYDRRHGWRGPEAHLTLAADETVASLRAHLRAYPFVHGLPTAIVENTVTGQATVLTAAGETLTLTAANCKWTARSPSELLQRGDVIRLLPGEKAEDLQLGQLPKAESALVSLDPEDGALRAVVGGLSFSRSKFNRATQAQRQPGSSFKPFLYSASFERGFTPASIVLDAPVIFKDRAGHVWRPQNDDGRFFGPMRLREALVQSRNLVSVRLLDAIGVDFARNYITRFGFKLEQLPPNLSMALGTASLTPMSVAHGYTVFANGGFLVEPYFIARVLDRRGVTVLYPHPPRACRQCPERLATETRNTTIIDGFDFSAGGPAKSASVAAASAVYDSKFVGPQMPALAPRAIDERTAFLASSLMRDVVLRGTATAAKVLNRADIGGKTGSTNDHRDAWFSGFGGGLVTTVWVGNDDFSSLGYREYGGKAALPIWIKYMGEATKDVPLNDITPPSGIVTANISPSSGNILPDGTPGSLKDFFKQEDYNRLISSGYIQSTNTTTQESFDIF